MVTTAQGNAPLQLSKEYIYAGGRLLMTEEPTPVPTPTPTPAGPPPTDLVATSEFPSPGVASVRLSWGAPASGPLVVSYIVECKRAGADFQQIAAVREPLHAYDDTAVEPDSAYLYRVRAVFKNTSISEYSNRDIATTVAFTDSSLKGVTIKAAHLTELRRAVNAVRALAGMSAASWTYRDPVLSPPEQRRVVHVEDVTDLRERLDEALAPLQLLTEYPADPSLRSGAVISALHFEQLRAKVQ